MTHPSMTDPSATEPRASGAPAAAVILAAGKGTRMRSARPKVLHEVAGLSMLGHTLAAIGALSPARLVAVVGHGADQVMAAAARRAPDLAFAVQDPQLGTAHAVLQARAALWDDAAGAPFAGDVFVLYADTPLIRPDTLARMAQERAAGAAVVVLGFDAADPTGYGRLITGPDGALERIVEEKDAAEWERAITLSNSGVMCVDGARLFGWLERIGNDNAKGEYYLTDLIGLARVDGARCAIARCAEAEVLGVNSRADLAAAEAAFQARARAEAMAAGATLRAPETVFFAYDTEIGADVVIEPNVVFGPGVRVESGAEIRAFSHLEGAAVAAGAVIGPFARLRPGAEIGREARVGNFVEVKNAVLGEGAKANHLSYIGDAAVGAGANIGAGTITCNYDGYLKHRTEIGEGAFIGSNTALVAPVSIGAGATIGAGSTITDAVPADALALGRARQATKPGLAARLRTALAAAKEAQQSAEAEPREAAAAAPDRKTPREPAA